jgi:UDP-glucuronate 4-epimerase
VQRLLRSGQRVVGLDSLNAYYDPRLKAARLDILGSDPRFRFEMLDLADRRAIEESFARQQFPVVVRRGGGTR